MKFAYLIEPPFNDRDAEGNVIGCDVELANYVLSALGVANVELVETEFGELLPGLADSRWQMTTGLFATDERRKQASFSRPVWALPDGLLVAGGNPHQLAGYQSVADSNDCVLAVIRDQFQHRTAVEFGVPENRIQIFETYTQAALAVKSGQADAYASVDRAHAGFINANPQLNLSSVPVPDHEKPPAVGCFAFNSADHQLRNAVDDVLNGYIGSREHRTMMANYGFSNAEIDLLL